MPKAIFWVVATPLFIFVIVFAASNPQSAALNLWPFAQLDVPLYSIALVGALFGFVLGFIIGWMQSAGARVRVRGLMRDLETERRELINLREKVAKLEALEQQATIPAKPAATL